ncbi:membrane lipoprotein lipid attachment site-containing protein [Pectobacterium polaris]|uniref:Membrane lipoprotein lipid attachment site-containing protein n=1 Tax=Pectobacterium polaris TaxID=2042057 RepID=A0AAW4NV86_9GAMM|nr:hypothetical protein [Pectobacterium polaris]MBW5891019.1 membrane lipoprotein lipid attachment site-containing protein [Pectobacterium polaris]
MRKIIFTLIGVTLLTGCTVNLPFNNRLGFDSVKDVQSSVQFEKKPSLNIKWDPNTFPKRIDIQGADGFVGGGSRTRVPTGVALSARIEEAIATFANISVSGKPLTITVVEARSGFEYSAGVFNITPGIDVGTVYLKTRFNLDGVTWSNEYKSQIKDPTIGGTSQTGILEAAWDDVAVQVAKDIASKLK